MTDGDHSRPSQLSRDSILESATELVDREGLRQLTMRRLGSWCGVEAMALYRYVSGREDLVTGIVDRVIDQLYDDQLQKRDDQLQKRDTEGGWQEYLQRVAHGFRDIAFEHPELFPLIATRPPEAPWIRPPLRSLKWTETFLSTLGEFGFDDDAAVSAYKSFTTFLLGHLLLEVSSHGTEIGPEDARRIRSEPPDLSACPNLRRLQHQLEQDHGHTEFEVSLENLLDRIELEVE
ncbi:TetR/AcrR family transcriptional regulator C-terminal domain-containing protein [Rhodococcus sp. HNM0569]|uniref:TetR/AcrR family transcriptional regulator n=1 Tax=Rhodococcus sp. HNM0569 TaxID=2716340 RepID=UPI00146D827E|nr:TetR/AcrR family transcriptional regulator C-terminal domain-containing protein [Rhodococcus sp. HNM0569]NLU82552.1 TetR family transcriptional regulator [Rhodococcus sp. HNM0569]